MDATSTVTPDAVMAVVTNFVPVITTVIAASLALGMTERIVRWFSRIGER